MINRLLIILLLTSIFAGGCENDDKRIRDLTQKVEMKETATDVDSYLSQGGKMRARLQAPLMYRVSADTIYVEFPKKLHVDFYNDSLTIDSRLDCLYGKYYESLNKVYLRDSVVLWWDQNTKMFYTDKYAIYHGIGKSIYGGKGLTATQDLSSVTFHETTGTMQVSENGFPK